MSRNPLLAKVHIAKKELGLDDDTYRDVLEGITGKRSAAQLSEKQLATVLDVFKGQGFQPKKNRNFVETKIPEYRKALVLWALLYEGGVVRDKSPKALLAYIKRLTKVDRIEWLDPGDWRLVIETLKQWCFRVGVQTDD